MLLYIIPEPACIAELTFINVLTDLFHKVLCVNVGFRYVF